MRMPADMLRTVARPFVECSDSGANGHYNPL
jgi:hypothetical protein